MLPIIIALTLATPIAYASKSASIPTIPSEANVQIHTDPSGKTWPWRSFRSAPYLPPNFTVSGNGKPLADGFIFLTPAGIDRVGCAESAGFIVTSDGELVYALPVPGLTDFRKQYYNGSAYLTYWSGYNTDGLNVGHGYGRVNFIDDTYQSFFINPDLHLDTLTNGSIANGSIDIHEHQLTPKNTILVTAYNNTPYDLSAVKGPANGWIVDSLVFEIDIATQQVLFSWRASDHVPLSASKQPISSANESAPWDWFHVNAIEAVGDDYLVNSRHHWTTYLVSGQNGSIIWSLEGETGGSFGALPGNGTFRWQHHARAHNVTKTSLDLSLFDNHNSAVNNGTGETKALVYHLELPPNKSVTPQLKRRLVTPSEPLYADSQGSYVTNLDNDNQFVGYGQLAISREYGPASDGSDLRWQGQFGGLNTVQSYRGFKQTWNATPADWSPNLVVNNGQGYVSWNGATEVQTWNVYIGDQASNLQAAAVAVKRGFETGFAVPDNATFVQVGAVQSGIEVRRSNVVHV